MSIHIVGVLLLLSSVLPSVFAQTFPCGEDGLYLIMSPSISKNSELYRLRIDTTEQESYYELIGKLDRQIDAAGHSVADGLIYGIDRNSQELIRISPDAKTENLGVPLYLDTTLQYYAGTIGPQGRRLFVIGRDPFTQHDEQLFRIDLFKPNFVTGAAALHSNAYVQIDDFAYDPLYGSIFGFNRLDQRLVRLSGGQVNDFNYLNTNQSSGMGSILFDGNAQLYGYGLSNGGSSEGNLFTIDKFNGTVAKFDGGPSQVWTDACACPYFVKFEKTISPQNVLPCGEVRIVYRFQNHGGTSFSLESLKDTLSPYLTITQIEPIAFSYDTIIGVGGHILTVERPSLYIGLDSIVIWASVDPQAMGEYESQAHLSALPLMLGGERVSDDPNTLVQDDPSLIRFRPQGNLSLQAQASVLCFGDTIVLQAPGGGIRYLWSDGSTDQELSVTQGGTYWLEMENNCGLFRDTLFIAERTEPLLVDLGPEIEIDPGDSLRLNPTISGAIGDVQYQWRVKPNLDLSCQQCPNPTIQPQQNSRIYLQLKDEEGCFANDSVSVLLAKERKIFLPTAFSPNDDGFNDLFYIQGFGAVEIVNMRVFNRWGNLVFVREGGMINDTRHSWDGRSQGRRVAAGVYVWAAQLRFPDGEVETFSGSLTLIR